MTSNCSGVTLTVVAGTAGVPTRAFASDAPTPPVSVGMRGDWTIDATGVEPVHLYLAFDGWQLHVAAASPTAHVLLRGSEVGPSWRAVPVPSEIHFGGACIIVLPDDVLEPLGSEADPGGEADSDECNTLLRSSCSDGLVGADAPTLDRDMPTVLRMTDGAAGDVTQEDAPTCCDGGALRELAAQLASATPGVQPVSALPLVAPTPLSTETTPSSQAPPRLLSRFTIAWRDASRVQKAICALVPFALCAALWSPNSTAQSNASPMVSAARVRAASEYGTLTVATSAPSDSIVSTVAASASSQRDLFPILTTSTPAAPGAAPAIAARVAEQPLAVDSASDESPQRAELIAPTAQRDAFNAAKTGKLSEATELYRRLAVGTNASLFSQAARLARSNSVRTP